MSEPILRGALNRLLHIMARFSPGATSFRPFLHKLRGVKIYGNVFIGDDVYLENAHPECVEIHDGVTIALRSRIIAHNRGTGRVVIEKDVYIAPNVGIYCPHGQTLTIGEGSIISADETITRDVPRRVLIKRAQAPPVAVVNVPISQNHPETTYEEFRKGLVRL